MPEGPVIPEDVTGEELDEEARIELRTLPKDLATKVARHLVMAGRLVDDDPASAYRHAQAARRLASRVGIVREAAGLAAYHAGEWSQALAELRAARRLRNTEEAYLPILADCERGLGRPERALELVKSPAARRLDQADRIELRIVESGTRRDLGQQDAAVVALQIPELRDKRLRPWSARLFYAYADALLEAGREEEAAEWFARAAAADRDGETDAAERYAELEGLEILDLEDDGVEDGRAEDLTEDVVAFPDADEPAAGDLAGGTSRATAGPDEGDVSPADAGKGPAGDAEHADGDDLGGVREPDRPEAEETAVPEDGRQDAAGLEGTGRPESSEALEDFGDADDPGAARPSDVNVAEVAEETAAPDDRESEPSGRPTPPTGEGRTTAEGPTAPRETEASQADDRADEV